MEGFRVDLSREERVKSDKVLPFDKLRANGVQSIQYFK
jgi:hypothetical protein